MIKLTEIFSNPKQYDPATETVLESYGVREVFLNPRYVISVKENLSLYEKSQREELIEGLNRDFLFTELYLATPGSSPQRLDILGSPAHISEKISEAWK